MDNKEENVSKLLSFDVNIDRRKEDNSEMINDFDDDIFLIKNRKNKQKKIYLFFY